MKITVLGSSAAYPGGGQACSGFLIEEGSLHLLLDCGTGVLSNLQRHLRLDAVSAIIISHMHADHFFDLIPYRYALRYGLERLPDPRLPLWVPPGGREVMERVVAPFAENDRFFTDVFKIGEYDPTAPLPVGDFQVAFAAVHHYIPSYAVSVRGYRKIVYTSDTSACPELLPLAHGADLLLANVGRCLEPDRETLWGHLRPAEAGALAREAGAQKLILSHFWPGCDREKSRERAAGEFAGPVLLAEEGSAHEI